MGECETTKVDLWALGVIVYMMITRGKHPFVFKNLHELIKSIKEDDM
jgi:serine/threonine protein kinase